MHGNASKSFFFSFWQPEPISAIFMLGGVSLNMLIENTMYTGKAQADWLIKYVEEKMYFKDILQFLLLNCLSEAVPAYELSNAPLLAVIAELMTFSLEVTSQRLLGVFQVQFLVGRDGVWVLC